MKTFPVVLWILASLSAACASPGPAQRSPAGQHPLEQDLRQFQDCQQVFREQYTTPQTFDFPGQGRVTVREISLDGFPGNTYVRCRFHYQNRTDKPVIKSWVILDVLNSKGEMVASQASVCIIPIPIPIARGSFFADELRTQTFGAHLEPGWSWRIRCQAMAEEEEEPLDPPVPEGKPRGQHLPPMEIRQQIPRVN